MLELLIAGTGRGRYNNDTETHLDIGDSYLDVSRILDVQRLIFCTGANFSVSMQICWKVTASVLPFVALRFSSRCVFAYDKTSLLQKWTLYCGILLWHGSILFYSILFYSMWHAYDVMSKPAASFIRDCNKLWASTLPFVGNKPVSTSHQRHWHKSKTSSLEAPAIVSWRLLGLCLAIKLCLQHVPHQDGCYGSLATS